METLYYTFSSRDSLLEKQDLYDRRRAHGRRRVHAVLLHKDSLLSMRDCQLETVDWGLSIRDTVLHSLFKMFEWRRFVRDYIRDRLLETGSLLEALYQRLYVRGSLLEALCKRISSKTR